MRYLLISTADAPAYLASDLPGAVEMGQLAAILLRGVRTADLLVTYVAGVAGKPRLD